VTSECSVSENGIFIRLVAEVMVVSPIETISNRPAISAVDCKSLKRCAALPFCDLRCTQLPCSKYQAPPYAEIYYSYQPYLRLRSKPIQYLRGNVARVDRKYLSAFGSR
jgi:hypothetical protein